MPSFSYLRSKQIDALDELAQKLAARAASVLDELGAHLRKARVLLKESATAIPSLIPGHETVSYERPVVGNFIAAISDLRDTTTRLRQAIGKPAAYSLAERVYFETAVALPIIARTMLYFDGRTTEYLGDGTLTLFVVPGDDGADKCEAAFKASVSAVEAISYIVNPLLTTTNLPKLAVGVGIGMSRALVSAIGLPERLVPNAFGECVFPAAKLSKWGENEIYADSTFEANYPTSEGGKIRFRRIRKDEIDGFLVSKQSVA
jgi:hypothetical protein